MRMRKIRVVYKATTYVRSFKSALGVIVMLHQRQGLHPVFTTAYALNYPYSPSQAHGPSPSHRRPSLQLHDGGCTYITQNLHVPKCPHRRLLNDSPTALGVGRAATHIPLLVEKPIVRSPRPADFNQQLRADCERLAAVLELSQHTTKAPKPLPDIVCTEETERLSVRRRYTSTTREATEEAALPTPERPIPRTTLQREADPVRYRKQRYYTQPCAWQRYAREWDTMQLRRSSEGETNTFSLPKIEKNISLTTNEGEIPSKAEDSSPDPKTDQQLAQKLVFTRPMPGYGGFVPRHAVEPHPLTERDHLTASMCSTSRRTYRSFPDHEYNVLQFAHQGPFSKTVTMTHPLNPFNKVEHHMHYC